MCGLLLTLIAREVLILLGDSIPNIICAIVWLCVWIISSLSLSTHLETGIVLKKPEDGNCTTDMLEIRINQAVFYLLIYVLQFIPQDHYGSDDPFFLQPQDANTRCQSLDMKSLQPE